MPDVRHHTLQVNDLQMHVTEQGEGPLVLLCHGWPELGYSWRHQLPALAEAGFRAVAPDMRGYGDTDAPRDGAAYSIFHLVGDMVGLLGALGEQRAIIVGHDWGAPVAWASALLRPDLFHAVAGLSVPHRGRGPRDPLAMLRESGHEGYYWLYFQEPGVAEAEFERDVTTTMRKVLFSLSGDAPPGLETGMVPPGGGLLDGLIDPSELPGWLSAQELAHYVSAFQKSGFRGGLSWYRNISQNWAQQAPWQGKQISQPALFIAGSRDPMIAGKRGAAGLANLKVAVPKVETLILEGAGHWIQQERPSEVNAALVAFVKSVSRR
jgi:pimeloyl-ACP methyl ester carboxylesterase